MLYTLPRVVGTLIKSSGASIMRPNFFTKYHPRHIGKDMVIVAPILRFPNGEVEPRFDIGTRGNGVDQPKWPKDLLSERVI